MANRPWEELRAQIYLGSEKFIEKHSPANIELKEIPRAHLRGVKAVGADTRKQRGKAIAEAYEQAIGSMRSQRIWRPLCDGEPQTQTARAIELKMSHCKTLLLIRCCSFVLLEQFREIAGDLDGNGIVKEN